MMLKIQFCIIRINYIFKYIQIEKKWFLIVITFHNCTVFIVFFIKWAQLWQMNLDEWETFPNIMLNDVVLRHISRWNRTYTVTLVALCQCHLSWLDIVISFYYTFCKPSVFTSRVSLVFVHSTLFLCTNIAKGKKDALIAEASLKHHQSAAGMRA